MDFGGPGFGIGSRASEDVGVVDRSAVLGVAGGEAGGGVHAGEFVGEDRDADASPTSDEAPGFGVGGGGGGDGGADAAADLFAHGVVLGGGAEVLDVDVERAEVGDEGILEGAAEGVCSGYDFEAAVGGLLRHLRCGGGNGWVDRWSVRVCDKSGGVGSPSYSSPFLSLHFLF
ncbi:hypothetical protein Vadar_007829 [Vaccinium darrowii]|uniref:Uncharacterized protein n=1 Tax=Vaccinium darrowii TaxID=229202 RepID=A0ACB7ZB46_9ERIC|nr:hypothetical protein Vadar_007829 [Vaccinium darrowii]